MLRRRLPFSPSAREPAGAEVIEIFILAPCTVQQHLAIKLP